MARVEEDGKGTAGCHESPGPCLSKHLMGLFGVLVARYCMVRSTVCTISPSRGLHRQLKHHPFGVRPETGRACWVSRRVRRGRGQWPRARLPSPARMATHGAFPSSGEGKGRSPLLGKARGGRRIKCVCNRYVSQEAKRSNCEKCGARADDGRPDERAAA